MIRKIKITALFSLILSVLPLFAQAQLLEEPYIAGEHYLLLDKPVSTHDKSKIEVVEIFWYGCPHCFTFEPMVKQWESQLPADVDFLRMPAMWNNPMKEHARIFYTAKALGVLDKIHEAIFTSLVVERKRLTDEEEIEELFVKYGVDKEAFRKTFKSFGVSNQVKQADVRTRRDYKISGTPEVIVNGKFRVTGQSAGGQGNMFKVVNYLINKERAVMPKSK